MKRNKGLVWTKGHKIKEIFVFPDATSDDAVNLIGQIQFIKYFENVVDPSIHVEITMADTSGSLDRFRIRSGSTIKLTLSHPSQDDELVLDLTISNIVAHIKDQNRELYTFVCETIGTFSNHTTRVVERYDGRISESVKSILTKILKIPKDQIEVEDSQNILTFYGNYRRAFKVISGLCPKAIPKNVDGKSESGNDGSAGYLFYQTQDKYHFKSIDELFNSEPMEEVYKMTPYKNSLNAENNFMLASEPNFKQSHDLIKNLRSGAYSTRNWYFNIVTRGVSLKSNFKVEKSIKKEQFIPANKEDALPPEKFRKPVTRFILGTVDSATTEESADGLGNDDAKQTQPNHQAQAAARYSALFSQVLEFTVPMNLSLRVGQVLNLEFPFINTDKNNLKKSPYSGKYMISRLSHEFGSEKGDYTGLSCVRDSFTTYE